LETMGAELGRAMTADYVGDPQQLDRTYMIDEMARIAAKVVPSKKTSKPARKAFP
jgi:hypothetical protein